MIIPSIEQLSPEQIREMQHKKLTTLLQYLQQSSPFYKDHFKRYNIQIENIRTQEDLSLIPPVTKEELQARNWDFLCVDRSRIADYTITSGTLGKPVTIALTENDLERLAYNEYISFVCADGRPGDLYQLILTLDRQFMAGMAYYAGIRRLGAGLVRTGPGLPSLQWEAIERLKPDTLVAVPSFIIQLIDYAKKNGIDFQKSSVRKAICIGENIRRQDGSYSVLAEKIVQCWDLKLYSTYASTEMQTAFTECSLGQGGHHHPELLIVEFLDEQNRPVGPGEFGEVTITTLGVEGMPLLRYKTGDICTRYEAPCACGRSTFRISPVLGRKNQMIKLKGTTLYPPALIDLLNEITEVTEYQIVASKNELETDEITLYLACNEPDEATKTRIGKKIQAHLRVLPEIHFHPHHEITAMQFPENNRKAIRFLDKR